MRVSGFAETGADLWGDPELPGKSWERPILGYAGCSKLEPFGETKFGKFWRNLAEIWQILANFGGILANFGGIALW